MINIKILKNLSICKICGEKIIYDAWSVETHMQHNHPEKLEEADWYDKYIREVDANEIINIILNNIVIIKQYMKGCNCFYCDRVRQYHKLIKEKNGRK